MMKRLARIIAIVLIVLGALWSLQGLGILMWPPHSFMLAQREWGLYGAIVAAFGGLIWLLSARFGPRQ
ncbi:MAG: hypothetical protein QNI87_04620 [Erythrobacter sp.]|uniref:hypothetical protein n=1 Tax=Erythrobacter sp. TaxID=1042 RepID=UPI002626D035|nr:hypothetical protein [Erythrobacter sp.]MDJ0977798.1 hypothetical protein [Erythrobacter sp.]